MNFYLACLFICRESFLLVKKTSDKKIAQIWCLVCYFKCTYLPSFRTIWNIVSKKPGTLSEPWVSICAERSYQHRFDHIDHLAKYSSSQPFHFIKWWTCNYSLKYPTYIIQQIGNDSTQTYLVRVVILIYNQILFTNLEGNEWQWDRWLH